MAAADWASQLHEDMRRRVLRRLLQTDRRINGLYEKAAKRIRRELRASQFTEADVARIVAAAMEEAEAELLPQVERELEAAAEGGSESARRTLAAIRGRDGRPLRSGPRLLPRAKRLSSGSEGD